MPVVYRFKMIGQMPFQFSKKSTAFLFFHSRSNNANGGLHNGILVFDCMQVFFSCLPHCWIGLNRWILGILVLVSWHESLLVGCFPWFLRDCLVLCFPHLANLPGDETVHGQVPPQLTIVKEDQETAFKNTLYWLKSWLVKLEVLIVAFNDPRISWGSIIPYTNYRSRVFGRSAW